MKYFAGLDVGLEETAICIIDSDGRIVRELTAFSEPEALVGALRATAVDYARVGLEACPLAPWLFEHLAAAGLPVICLEVRHLRAALAAMTHKTDRNDARGIAQILRTGVLKVHGLKVGRVTRITFAPRVRELVTAVPALAAVLEPLLSAHATLRASFAELHRQVLALTRARSGVPPAHDRPRGRCGHSTQLLQRRGSPRTVPAL